MPVQRVAVWFHKDGDRIAVIEIPRWVVIYEWMLERVCPCCGALAWTLEKLDKLFRNEDEDISGWFFSKWSNLYTKFHKKQTTLYEAPIASGCLASQKIFKKKEACWQSDCEDCWEFNEDAYESRRV